MRAVYRAKGRGFKYNEKRRCTKPELSACMFHCSRGRELDAHLSLVQRTNAGLMKPTALPGTILEDQWWKKLRW